MGGREFPRGSGLQALGKGLAWHRDSATSTLPIAPAAADCTQLHSFRGRESPQAWGNPKQLEKISTARKAKRRERDSRERQDREKTAQQAAAGRAAWGHLVLPVLCPEADSSQLTCLCSPGHFPWATSIPVSWEYILYRPSSNPVD